MEASAALLHGGDIRYLFVHFCVSMITRPTSFSVLLAIYTTTLLGWHDLKFGFQFETTGLENQGCTIPGVFFQEFIFHWHIALHFSLSRSGTIRVGVSRHGGIAHYSFIMDILQGKAHLYFFFLWVRQNGLLHCIHGRQMFFFYLKSVTLAFSLSSMIWHACLIMPWDLMGRLYFMAGWYSR